VLDSRAQLLRQFRDVVEPGATAAQSRLQLCRCVDPPAPRFIANGIAIMAIMGLVALTAWGDELDRG